MDELERALRAVLSDPGQMEQLRSLAGALGLSPPEEAQSVPEAPAAPETDVEALESLSVLADRHRVPSWQQAALCRFMGWEDGKMVSDAEYREALNSLKRRRLGGGRMA